MDISKDKCSPGLILLSVAVLAVKYGFLTVESLSINAGGLSLNGIATPNGLLLPIAACALLVGLSICHILHHWPEVSERFRSGYRECPAIVELVRSRIAEVSGTARYGSLYGGIRGSLRNKSFELGQFQTDDGALSASVIVRPSSKEHRGAAKSGIARSLSPRLWLGAYAPLFLGFWSLIAVAA